MDFNSLMEEARANQERKAKILARMKESQKQNEVEKQRKEREKQAQAQVRKVNRIKHTTNHTLKDGKKQSELQVKYKKNPIETNTKVAKHKTHREEQQKHQQPNIHILKRKLIQQEKHNSIPKPKIKKEGNNSLNKPVQIHKVEGRELNSKPSLSTEKKAALNFNELMELAKKNVGKNTVKPEETAEVSSAPPPLPISHKPVKGVKLESESEPSKGAEKRRIIEEFNKPTDSSKKLKLNKKQSQPPPQEPPKPRPQIQQSEYFRKTFDTLNSSKKPPYQTSRFGPSAPSSSRQDESSSDGDGFIVSDDDESSNFNVSKFIQNMFRYNKSKYVDEDEGAADEAMVSSFSQQQFEEKRSARIGMLEDLEDVKREEEELRKKTLIKKKKDKKLKRLQI